VARKDYGRAASYRIHYLAGRWLDARCYHLLDQLTAYGVKITLDLVQTVLGAVASQSAEDVVGALSSKMWRV
jgi:hypothetical protein